MKSIIVVLSLLLCSVTYAQERNSETKQETETKTVKVKSEKGTVEKKMKVTTTEKQDIEVKEDPNHNVNMVRVPSETKVTQTVEFDSDFDPFYDSKTESQMFYDQNTEYMFEPNDMGFTMSMKGEADTENVGSAMLTSVKRLYLINMGNNNGVGYFNKDGNFVVEFYDKESNTMVVKEFNGKNM